MKRISIFFFVFLVLLLNLSEAKQKNKEYVRSKTKTIAIFPFQTKDHISLSREITKIIANDLSNSGQFNIVFMDQLLKNSNFNSKINLFKHFKIDMFLTGKIQSDKKHKNFIHYELFSIVDSNKKNIIKNIINITDKIRYDAHTISDEIFKKITNIPGLFRTKIAYVVKRNDKENLYELRISDYDGFNKTTIAKLSNPLMSPAWSPDGQKIVYVMFEKNRSVLVMKNLLNGLTKKITNFKQHNGSPSFSPDGRKLAFVLSKSGTLNIYVLDLINGKINQITNSKKNNTEPSWMPDNKTIVYTSDQEGYPQIYKINIYGGMSKRITNNGYQNQNAVISSSGAFMVMVSIHSGQQHITKQNLVTNSVEYLTDTFLDETPSIAPNDTMIIYSCSSKENLNNILRLVSVDGCFNMRFPEYDGQVKFPAWSPLL
ncbi:MAG: Tol-Pal system beta propeller repeat protein TolB [Arsenophonus sp.]|nr:MAG: Tol-Pal system beta propeller repeat protein TolB [Arsenophonus sp.]